MKIAFDAKRITHNATGLGNYSRFVVNSLSASFPEHTYQLYTPGKGKEALRKRIEERPNVSFHYPEGRFDKLFPSLWRTSGLTATLRKERRSVPWLEQRDSDEPKTERNPGGRNDT